MRRLVARTVFIGFRRKACSGAAGDPRVLRVRRNNFFDLRQPESGRVISSRLRQRTPERSAVGNARGRGKRHEFVHRHRFYSRRRRRRHLRDHGLRKLNGDRQHGGRASRGEMRVAACVCQRPEDWRDFRLRVGLLAAFEGAPRAVCFRLPVAGSTFRVSASTSSASLRSQFRLLSIRRCVSPSALSRNSSSAWLQQSQEWVRPRRRQAYSIRESSAWKFP